MKLEVLRYSSQEDDTLGLLLIDGKFECHTLEDEHREVKVKGETRINDGTYPVTLRTVGGFHSRYSNHKNQKIRSIHKGMLWIRNVPNFEYVLIHCGNHEGNTAGCLLVGSTANNNKYERGFIGHSILAYCRMYVQIIKALEAGEKVTITYRTIES